MNLDVIAAVLLVAGLSAFFAFWWKVVRGHASSGWQRAARIGGALALALALVAVGAYWLMDSLTVQLLGDHVSQVDTTRKVVAITFDDGPANLYVDDIIGDLRRYGARATFYVVGADARANPEAMSVLVAAREEIGNHSYDHRRLVFVSTSTCDDELSSTDAVIRAAGYSGPVTFRPPYAKKLLSLPYVLWRAGRTTVMWDLAPDSRDDIRDDAQAMTQYVVDHVRPGSIVLLHPWPGANAATRRALPLILGALRAQGYSFLTVSELLALR